LPGFAGKLKQHFIKRCSLSAFPDILARPDMGSGVQSQQRTHKRISYMKTISRTLENSFNRINDWDGTWIGFHRLKPAPGDFMSVRTVAELSLRYAPDLVI